MTGRKIFEVGRSPRTVDGKVGEPYKKETQKRIDRGWTVKRRGSIRDRVNYISKDGNFGARDEDGRAGKGRGVPSLFTPTTL